MPESPLDIVSIDYVADAIYELCECPLDSAHKTFHLTASEDASTFAEIVSLAARYFRRPEPLAVPPAEFAAGIGKLSDSAIEAIRVYFPYFAIATGSRTRGRGRGSRRPGSTAPRCANICTGCSTLQPAAAGVSARSGVPRRPRAKRRLRRPRRCFGRRVIARRYRDSNGWTCRDSADRTVRGQWRRCSRRGARAVRRDPVPVRTGGGDRR